MQRLSSALHYVDILSEWSGKTMSFLPLFMMVFIIIEVTVRAVLNVAIHWVPETVQFMYGAGIVFAGAYVMRYREHVRMDLLYQRLTPRKKAYLDLVAGIFCFLFCGVLLWFGWSVFLRTLLLGERTYSTWAPLIWPIKLTLPVATFLTLLQGLANFTRDILTATGRELR